MTDNWTKTQTSELINLYRQYPLLYNPNHEKYNNRLKRIEALESILRRLKTKPNASIFQVRSKIKTLRSQYLKEVSKMKKLQEEGSENDPLSMSTPSLWCFEEMTFISSGEGIFEEEDSMMGPPEEDVIDNETVYITQTPKKPKIHLLSDKSVQTQEIPIPRVQIVPKATNTPHYNFGKTVETELMLVDDDLFHEAKWEIYSIIKNAQQKHRARRVNSSIQDHSSYYRLES